MRLIPCQVLAWRAGFFTKFAKKVERGLMVRLDGISTISYSKIENARLKVGIDSRLIFFPNWADAGFVNPQVKGSSLRSEWGFSDHHKVILYAGNSGKKQGLELLLEAAEYFHEKSLVQFVILGTGAHESVLVENAKSRGLTNIHFKPFQPWDKVPECLPWRMFI